jgi:integrase/recombinase XerD
MKYLINDDLALSRPPEGPVASYIVPFAEWLGDRDYGSCFHVRCLVKRS